MERKLCGKGKGRQGCQGIIAMAEGPQDWHEPLRDWCTAMEHRKQGLAILSNLLHDAKQERLHEGVLGRFLKDVAKEWEDARVSLPSDDPELQFGEAREVFQRTVRAKEGEYLCSGDKVGEKLQPNGCRRRAAAPKSEEASPREFSHVMNAADFLKYHIKLGKAALEVGDDQSVREEIDRLEESGLQGAIKESCIRGELPVVWVTRTRDLAELKKKTKEESCCADTVRAYLGLFHLQNGHMVEIQYTEDKLKDGDDEELEVCVPTSLEGYRSPAFRSKTGYDGWGCTVKLNTEGLVCGLPEAVHKEIKFTEDGFEFDKLGYLSDLGPSHKREEKFLEEFLGRCPCLWVPEGKSYADLLSFV